MVVDVPNPVEVFVLAVCPAEEAVLASCNDILVATGVAVPSFI